MKLFENGVGRPSNEVKKKRKIFVVSVAAILLVAIVGIALVVINIGGVGNLKGAAIGLGKNSGDADGDGKITLSDVRLILNRDQRQNKKIIINTNADYDKNGKIEAKDARELGLYVVEELLKHIAQGDVNQDGEITSADARLVSRYLKKKEEFSIIQKKLADINNDGKVNNKDKQMLEKIAARLKKRPNCGKSTKLKGDVDGDGRVTNLDSDLILKYSTKQFKIKDNKYYVNNTLFITENADVNGDSKINAADAREVNNYVTNQIVKYYAIGDVNLDGKITSADTRLVDRYLAHKEKLSSVQIKVADIDKNGKVNAADWRAIGKATKIY